MARLKQILLLVFLAWFLVRVIKINKLLRTAGIGVPVFNHNPGPCQLFHVNGSEDIDVLPNGLAVFSSGLEYHLNPLGIDPLMRQFKGMLYTFDFNNPEEKPRPLSYENFNGELSPHGIDFFTDPETGEVRLFVVNHAAGNQTVEIFTFDVQNMILRHQKTAYDKNIYFPNDVVAVGRDSFYTTNDHYFKSKALGLVETFYPLKFGNVAFYDGKESKIVAQNFNFANGITMDTSGKYVFLASSFDGEVTVFERQANNDLVEQQRFKIDAGLDNIAVDEDGHLWLGVGHFDIFEHSKNFSKPCAGSAIQIKLKKAINGENPFVIDDIRQVFGNDGKGEFKCVSSAVYHRGGLLIGNPFSNLMYCKVREY